MLPHGFSPLLPGDHRMAPDPSNAPQPNDPKVQLYAKHSLLTRSLHWLNMVAISALIATGIAMMIGGDWLKSVGGSVHELFYLLLFAVGGVYLLSLLVGGGWKMFVPTRATLEDAASVVKSELHLGTHEPRLQKYNGAQRLAYAAVLLMVAGEVVTGLAMAYHDQLPWLATLLGGRHAARSIHKLLMFGIVAFVIVHVVQVFRAGWPSLRSMISGYSVVPAGGGAALDGALPEPNRLGVPVPQSAAFKSVDAQTRRGLMGAAAAGVTGLVLLAVGTVREAGAEGTPHRHHRGAATATAGAERTSFATQGAGGGDLERSSDRGSERRGEEGGNGDGDADD
jgi:thiosulfate reductase cytochrome b subunit